jgi:hypothetical protein
MDKPVGVLVYTVKDDDGALTLFTDEVGRMQKKKLPQGSEVIAVLPVVPE